MRSWPNKSRFLSARDDTGLASCANRAKGELLPIRELVQGVVAEVSRDFHYHQGSCIKGYAFGADFEDGVVA